MAKEYFIKSTEQILENTDPKVLEKLFKCFADKLIEENKYAGIFSVDDDDFSVLFDEGQISNITEDMIKNV